MKKHLIPAAAMLTLLLTGCHSDGSGRFNKSGKGTVIHLTEATFKEKVFNYDLSLQWKYEGDLPAVVDFYADWCKPCLEMSPSLDEIAREYRGKIVIYKVDITDERQLAEKMQVKRLPLLVFIPLEGNPKLVTKALPKELLVKTVEELLLVK
jgi:thiol-disulfide isomerase/thioredoxin